MAQQLKTMNLLYKFGRLPQSDKARLIALLYLEEGKDTAIDVARIANIPVTRVEQRNRWAIVEEVQDAVGDPIEEVQERDEEAEDSIERVDEEYIGYSIIKRISPWK